MALWGISSVPIGVYLYLIYTDPGTDGVPPYRVKRRRSSVLAATGPVSTRAFVVFYRVSVLSSEAVTLVLLLSAAETSRVHLRTSIRPVQLLSSTQCCPQCVHLL